MSVANRSLRPKRTGKKKQDGVKGLPPFVGKLYAMVDDPATDRVISWGPNQDTFIVHRPEELASDLLPQYFKHNNFCSFIRQVNTYGFTKVSPDNWEFVNEYFKKGQTELLQQIIRRTSVKRATEENQKTEKQSKSKIKEGDISMQVEELTKANFTLQKELHKLKEERETHEQLVNYFAEELKHSRDKQKELVERERQMLGLLQKLVFSNGEGMEKEREEIRKKLAALRNQPTSDSAPPTPLADDLVDAFLGVKIENGSDASQQHPQHPQQHPQHPQQHPQHPQQHPQLAQPPQHLPLPRSLLEQPRSPPQPYSDPVVPSSPLWNSWPTDFFGNLMENNDPFMPVPQGVHPMEAQQVVDAELDADLASMVDDLSFNSNFSSSSPVQGDGSGTTTTTVTTATPMIEDTHNNNKRSSSSSSSSQQAHMHPFLFHPMQLVDHTSSSSSLPPYRFQPQNIFSTTGLYSNTTPSTTTTTTSTTSTNLSNNTNPNPNSSHHDFASLQQHQTPPASPQTLSFGSLSFPPSSPSFLSVSVKPEHASPRGEGVVLSPPSPLSGITASPLSSIPSSPLPGGVTVEGLSPLSPNAPPSPFSTVISPTPSSPTLPDESPGGFNVLDVLNAPASNPEDCRHIEELAGQLQMMTSG